MKISASTSEQDVEVNDWIGKFIVELQESLDDSSREKLKFIDIGEVSERKVLKLPEGFHSILKLHGLALRAVMHELGTKIAKLGRIPTSLILIGKAGGWDNLFYDSQGDVLQSICANLIVGQSQESVVAKFAKGEFCFASELEKLLPKVKMHHE